MRAGRLAVSAADAVHAVGIFPDGNVELAGLLAESALGAFFAVDFESIERDFVENSVNRTERADVATKRTVDYNRRKKRQNQNREFPAEQKAGSSAHRPIQKHERDSAFERADRADELAEPGFSKPRKVSVKGGEQNHEHDEENEPHFSPHVLQRKAADFFHERNFIKKILHKPEWTQKSADEAAEDRSKNDEETCDIERDFKIPRVQECLQRADWTRGKRTRTGIAVHPRNAERFCASFKNVAFGKALHIAVRERRD